MKRCYVVLLALGLVTQMHAHVISEALNALNAAAVIGHENGILAKEVGERGAKVADAVIGNKVGYSSAKYAVELVGFVGGAAVGHFAGDQALAILARKVQPHPLSDSVKDATKEAFTEVKVKIALDLLNYAFHKAGVPEEQLNHLLNVGDHLKLDAVDSRLAALANFVSHNLAYAVLRNTVKELTALPKSKTA